LTSYRFSSIFFFREKVHLKFLYSLYSRLSQSPGMAFSIPSPNLSPAPYHRPVHPASRPVFHPNHAHLIPSDSRSLLIPFLSILHVPFESWLRESGLRREFKETATSRLWRFHKALGEESRRWRLVLRKGAPRVVILAEAVRRRADLIVLGTHGRSGVSHALLGGVAEWVVSEAACDVAITRPMRYSFELP
jgi:hypothetical protein